MYEKRNLIEGKQMKSKTMLMSSELIWIQF